MRLTNLTRRRLVLLAVLLALVGSCAAESIFSGRPRAEKRDQQVKRGLKELFGLCQARDLRKAAAYCVYRGSDERRRWRDVYNPAEKDERAEVTQICARIRAYLDEGAGYEFVRFRTRRESEGEWYWWQVKFRRGKNVQKASFAFLRIRGRYLLGDID